MTPQQPAPSVRVWDWPVRVLHLGLVATVTAAWFTRHGFGWVHEWLGFAAMAIASLRILWGFSASRYGRFAQFLRSPAHTTAYAAALARHRAPRYLGHNPLGGWMAVALLLAVLAVTGSGWLYITDRYWGLEWVENLHDGLTWALIGLVALHLAGVVYTSLAKRENLVGAMLHGRKRPAAPGDVDD